MDNRMYLKAQMTPWERKRAYEQGQEIDRVITVPFMSELKCFLTGASVYDWWHEPKVMSDVEIQLFERYGYDRIVIGPNTRGITEALGGKFSYAKGVPQLEKPLLSESYEAVDRIEAKQLGRHMRIQTFIEALERVSYKVGEIVPIEASIGGPFTIASNLRGIEAMLRDCRKAPEQIHKLMRVITDAQKAVIDEVARHANAGIAMADPVANPMLIGPKMYERFVFPYTQELTDYAYEKTKQKVSLHMCGQTDAIWKYLAQYTLNEISLDNIVDLQKAAEELGKHVPIAGNVDPVAVIANGTREEIEEAVSNCIHIGKSAAKGFHLTTGCDIPDTTEAEKVAWFMEAAGVR